MEGERSRETTPSLSLQIGTGLETNPADSAENPADIEKNPAVSTLNPAEMEDNPAVLMKNPAVLHFHPTQYSLSLHTPQKKKRPPKEPSLLHQSIEPYTRRPVRLPAR
ncbi:hypothetical protein N5C46_19450 [Rossellomorea vietnamensis]|uniref:Uncharacterized protein n=1 Tax=Rossellomorea vietnamensis TaxID=218284 RepID=A0ACD4C596_9BACI|nr:hypothetical protein [Rossellomorea vietnamensis]UXH43788.1 hypothetical protein N5C46_19450 [Rossellomorea vietnamensis]